MLRMRVLRQCRRVNGTVGVYAVHVEPGFASPVVEGGGFRGTLRAMQGCWVELANAIRNGSHECLARRVVVCPVDPEDVREIAVAPAKVLAVAMEPGRAICHHLLVPAFRTSARPQV